MLTPNLIDYVKVYQNTPQKFDSNDSILIERVQKSKKVRNLEETNLTFWRGTYVEFDQNIMNKLLEHIRTTQNSEKQNKVSEENVKDVKLMKLTQCEIVEKLNNLEHKLNNLTKTILEFSLTNEDTKI